MGIKKNEKLGHILAGLFLMCILAGFYLITADNNDLIRLGVFCLCGGFGGVLVSLLMFTESPCD